jgi:hypothetical protein
MKYTAEDQLSYVSFLRKEYRKEKAKPETIAKMVNLNNIQADLNSLETKNPS